MKKIVFLLLAIMGGVAVSEPVGNYVPCIRSDSAYTIRMIHNYPDGTADTSDWNNTRAVDTVVDLGVLDQGYHLFDWLFLYVSDSLWHSAYDRVYVTETNMDKATGNMEISYLVDSCDTIIYIHEFNGVYDSATYTNLSAFDTSLACSSLSAGYHNNIVLFWFNGDDTWRSASEIFHNSAIGELPNPGPYLCSVYIDVQKVDGSGVRGVTFSGTLNVDEDVVQDTCRNVFFGQYTDKDKTNSSGRATINLIRSKCLVGGSLYNFRIFNPWTGERIYVTDSVPDSSSYKLKIREW